LGNLLKNKGYLIILRLFPDLLNKKKSGRTKGIEKPYQLKINRLRRSKG